MSSKKTPLEMALEKHRGQHLPWACFSMPHQNEVQLVLQSTDEWLVPDFCTTGFVAAPFDEAAQPSVFFRPDLQWVAHRFELGDPSKPTSQIKLSDQGRDDHAAQVRKALQSIEAQDLSKVVVARSIDFAGAFDFWLLFKRMLHAYPAAMVVVWSHPKVGVWMCATPERLLRTESQNLETVALAGTVTAPSLNEVVWGDKEIQEQQWVTRDIEQSLQKLGLLPSISPVATVQAGPLFHLNQTISADRNGMDLKTIVNALHPSPAIGGTPKLKALELIRDLEPKGRGFYAGYLGWIDADESDEVQADLYVTLRCLSWQDDCVTLYVGGGIVAGSHPDKEWEETQAKARVLARLLE
jgi:isochorismate synthase